MSRIAYVNGRYVPHHAAGVHIEDRGYQFADGVYEVMAVDNARLIDAAPHYDRLERSLGELLIDPPMTRAALDVVLREVVRRNRLRHGIVYLQITRGVAKRDHPFPDQAEPAVVATARRGGRPSPQHREEGIGVVTVPDIRWARCDIKSISLLPNVLAKQAARDAGGYEAWQVDDDGMVTEGSSTNAWIVDADGNLVTPPPDELDPQWHYPPRPKTARRRIGCAGDRTLVFGGRSQGRPRSLHHQHDKLRHPRRAYR